MNKVYFLKSNNFCATNGIHLFLAIPCAAVLHNKMEYWNEKNRTILKIIRSMKCKEYA